MSKNKKYGTISIKVKPIWERAKGHVDFRGDTTIDSRPKRTRTRQGVDKRWKDEYNG